MYFTALEFPTNCLSLNKDCSQIVAAGRNVFKVFSVEENEFIEKYNLRIGKTNLNYSTMDVVWNPVDDCIIASAATNGAVVTWNLNKSSRNKQDLVFNEHKRAVSKVAFHSNEYHLLMSGSQDGYMKIFDLRKKGVSEVFFGRSESVRDIQFNPHQYFQFAAAYENGNVQIWDIRVPSRYERQFTAHGEHVLSIDFHPEEKYWIATSGRDKLIKVWDMTNPTRTKNSHVVQTITPVAQIKWRPQRKYHIASCSLLLDFSVNVWDIRRPYIPFAAFNEHKDCVTGIQWKMNDPQVFFSSSRDCTLYAHAFKDAVRPADTANPVSIDLDTNGHILHATSNKIAQTPINTEKSPLTLLPARFRKTPDRSEQFTMVTSVLLEFTQNQTIHHDLDMSWFTESAQRYKLAGKTIDELCQHNAAVADALDRHHVAQSWSVLRLLFRCSTATPPVVPVTRHLLHRLDVLQKGDLLKAPEAKQVAEKEENRLYEKDSGDTGDTSTVSESDGSDSDDGRDMILTKIASGHRNRNRNDLFFDDAENEPTAYDYEELQELQKSQEGSLPEEALQLRLDMEQEIGGQSPQQSLHNLHAHHSNADNHISISSQHTAVPSQIRQELLSTPQFTDLMTPWKFKQHVCDMLQYYADKGDVQTAVSMLIVLADEIKNHIDEYLQEQWHIAYIDMLTRFKLYSVANRIMKLSSHASVEVLNQRSTTIHTNCGKCNKQMMRAGWLCDRCTNRVNTCCICHQPVKGLYVWCQGCCHGGHVSHMKQWFSARTYCPTGCGHLCEYT